MPDMVEEHKLVLSRVLQDLGKAVASRGWPHARLEQPGQTRMDKENRQHYEHSPFVRLCLSTGEQRALEAAHAPTRISAAGIHAIFTKKRLNSPFCHGVGFGRQSGP